MSMEENFKDASLHPPVHDHRPQDEACAPCSWAMIDVRAYIADRHNATTAYGRMSNGGEIQVTFCVAPPPVTSYFCIWCPEATHLNKIGTEPRIRAAEADLVVLCVALGSGFDCDDPKCQDFFVYHAGGGEKRPSLRLIKLDDPYCLFSNTGILRHCNDSDPEDDQYHIVAIRHSKLSWQFNLHIFDSKTDIWSSRRISVEGREHQHSQFRHSTRKVIMLGEGDMMAFVDPWRGLLVCNVLDSEATLHYIAFPRPLKDNKKILLNPVVARDIVVAQGFMKVIDCFYCCAKSAWKASVWRRVATSLENNWDRDHMFLIRDSLVDTNMSHFELFPKLQADGDNSPQKTLEALHIAHPILSLSDDHSVYFMAKVDPWDNRAWVLAVDLKNRRIQDVGVINDLRSHDVSLVFIHSRISKYFKTAPGIKGDSKRPGKFLRGRPFKKQAGAPVVDDIMQNDAVSSMGQQELMDLD